MSDIVFKETKSVLQDALNDLHDRLCALDLKTPYDKSTVLDQWFTKWHQLSKTDVEPNSQLDFVEALRGTTRVVRLCFYRELEQTQTPKVTPDPIEKCPTVEPSKYVFLTILGVLVLVSLFVYSFERINILDSKIKNVEIQLKIN